MTNVVFYDDTVTAFTNPTHLQQVYGVLWDEGIPIALGVTPVAAGVSGIASIPADKRLPQTGYRVSNNARLCNYLNVMAEQRLVEICQHGFHGITDEFNSDDDVLLQQKIEEGQAELKKAFPDAVQSTVCAPPDSISDTAIQLLGEYDFNIVTHDAASATAGKREALNDTRAIFRYGDPLLPDTPAPAELTTGDYLIVRVNYVKFFVDDAPSAARIDAFQRFCMATLTGNDMTIDTFSYI